jgi:transcriptional regulator with PAS, ATPase and Fis domain
MACALAAGGNTDRGRVHFDRAIRIYNGIRNVPGVIELSTAWRQVGGDESSPREASSAQTSARTEGHPSDLLQDVAALLIHAGRPELIATSAVALLGSTGHIRSAAATAVAADGSTETLASFDDLSKEPPDSTRTIAVGTSRGRSVSLTIALPAGLDACATINAVQLLLDVVHDLERARAERDERLTLWPIDDPADTEGAVVGGRMRDLMAQAQRFARTSAGVLITGESGTGKEILARAIHRYSPRADKPFVPFNCTAVPRDMLESQLFGHRRGAFTGADRDYPGLIRAAKGGTLFLDEVGELSLDLQPKLLRFLESGEIAPLGEPGTLTVDVRIVAATNRNLEQMVQEGRFREDLFYRLNIIPITIPPLRDRRDEIPALVHHFVDQAATEYQKGRLQVAQETMEQLLLHPWPGNIRQLQNEIRRLVVLADPDSVILPTHLTGAASQGHGHAAPPRPATGLELHLPVSGKLTCSVTKLEREMIRHALETTHGRLEDAAASLGISRKGLYLKRRRLGL